MEIFSSASHHRALHPLSCLALLPNYYVGEKFSDKSGYWQCRNSFIVVKLFVTRTTLSEETMEDFSLLFQSKMSSRARNWILLISEQHRYQGVSYKSDIAVISGSILVIDTCTVIPASLSDNADTCNVIPACISGNIDT